MLSSQKGTEFTGRDYDNIRKVYSIWICMNAPDYIEMLFRIIISKKVMPSRESRMKKKLMIKFLLS